MDDFDDDGFDDLNAAVLQELESKALQSLQSQHPFQRGFQQQAFNAQNVQDASAANGPGVIKIDDDVNQVDAEVLRALARVPTQHALAGRLAAAAAPPPLPLPAYSQRSFANVPLPAPNPNATHASNTMRSNAIFNAYYPGSTQAADKDTKAPLRQTVATTVAPVANTAADRAAMAALQDRVRTLETDLHTALGKASIMQSKYETAQQKYETELEKIRKQKNEELAQQRQRAEAAMAAHKNAATELEFVKQDLKEEIEKSKRGRRTGRLDAPTTPRKNTASRSNWDMADGFEDAELLPSPSRGFARRLKDAVSGGVTPAVERTPTKGKRRRTFIDSPTILLETVAVDEQDDAYAASPGISARRDGNPVADANGMAPTAPQPDESSFLFLQNVLGHQTHPGQPTTVELFSRYSFPSNRKQTLAFIILQRIPELEGRQGSTRLMLDFCQLVLGIWSQCLRERYFAPVRALISLLSYVLTHDLHGIAPHLLEALIPLAQKTAFLVTEPAFFNPNDCIENHPDYAVRQLACDIDVGAIIALLRLVAFGCLSHAPADGQTQYQPSQGSYNGMSTTAQVWFWSLVHFEFVLLLLSSKQPPEAFLGMLSLLQTSALPDSIGPITNDPAIDAGVVASTIIDRICHHLEEPPKWVASSKYTEWDVRLRALGVLDCFSHSPFGKLGLAASHCALPRLAGVFFPAYGELRDRDLIEEPLHPPLGQLPVSESQIRTYGIGGVDLTQPPVPTLMPDLATRNRSCIPLVLLYISSTVFLLHSIATDPFTATIADLPTKLAQKRSSMLTLYILTMARLGFRADPAFSTGLGEETYGLALELFKLAATPDEIESYSEWAQQGSAGRLCNQDKATGSAMVTT